MPMATRNSEAVKNKHVLFLMLVFVMFVIAGTIEFESKNRASGDAHCSGEITVTNGDTNCHEVGMNLRSK